MAKNSGGTRTKYPSKGSLSNQIKKIDSLYADGFSNEKVFIKLKNITEQTDFLKIEKQITNSKDLYDINHDKVVSAIQKNGYTVNADVDKLISVQNYLNKEQVAKYMSKENYDGIVGFGISGTNKVILVDGNHRAEAAKINGKNTVPVKILMVSNEKFFKSTRKSK